MEKSKSIPFAMYDLAVYLPGGAIILALLRYIMTKLQMMPAEMSALIPNDSDTVSTTLRIIYWVAACYLAGHLSSFISTYIIEKPVHHYFGYPSENWIDFEDSNNQLTGSPKTINDKIRDRANSNFLSALKNYEFRQIIVILSQIPSLPLLFVIFWRELFGFCTPKTPAGLKKAIEQKLSQLGLGIHLTKGSRWEKVVEHYVSNNISPAHSRMYNYLIIYGALRLMSLILLTICWMQCVQFAYYFFYCNWEFSLKNTLYYTFSCIIYVASVMAFAKFNRRYFEESIMAILLGNRALPTDSIAQPQL